MTRTYSAADFESARFAEHPDGGTARTFPQTTAGARWSYGGAFVMSDEQMADEGWVPVIPARTIHDRDVEALCTDKASYERDDYLDGFIRGFQQAGGVILEDPEPTNTDNLTELMKEIDQAIGLGVAPRTVAKYLNDNGVTAPNVKGN